MNIDDMPAGPELDLLVASGPMGWVARKTFLGVAVEDATTRPGHCEIGRIFSPTINIAHAWEVAEKFRLMVFPNKNGWAAATVRYDSAGEGSSHGEHWIDESLDHYATAPAAPLAICRAALKAAGIK